LGYVRRAGLRIGMTRDPGGCTPGFLQESAQPVGRTRDSCDPKNERVRKRLNPKSGRSGVGVKEAGRIGLTRRLVYTPTPGYCVSAGIIGVTRARFVCAGIVGLSRAFVGSREGRRVERERRPREPFGSAQGRHEGFSQDIANLSIVFCSTGSILYRNRYGIRSNCGNKEAKAHLAGEAGMRLVATEVMEVMHDGAAQVAEDEPEYGLENFLGCR